ncbi:MAG: phosphoglycerate kinase [Gammaproteobacteria bacterium]|nr:phosphoglycerate kinase [Gammaproteobacteria bacterium]
MSYRRMSELDLHGKRVLIREDLNVVIKEGKVVNDTRLRAALPTIEEALDTAEQVILMSHLGRPEEGVPISQQPEFSMQPVADHLTDLLDRQVPMVANYRQNHATVAKAGKLIMLENVRLNEGEKHNDEPLAQDYAKLCEVFVMDAFGTAHRAQASTHGVARFASEACAGPLLAKELDSLDRLLANPERPLLAIVGGAKVSNKLKLLSRLSGIVDQLIVGGGIANTFLLASGVQIGASLCEPELIDTAQQLMEKTSIPLPQDVVVATEFDATAVGRVKSIGELAKNDKILDIGPKTAKALSGIIAEMRTILWNGPVGVFEFDNFAHGTKQIAEAVAANTGFSIAGGGETIAAIDKFGVTDKLSYISTGGGAFLEYVQGNELPAVAMLRLRA